MVAGFVGSQLVGPGARDAGGVIIGADFAAFYGAATAVVDQEPLYDLRRQRAQQRQLSGDADSPFLHAFLNPPAAALVVAPLGLLPYGAALALWWGLSGLVLLLVIRRVSAELTHESKRTALEAVTFYPVLATFFFGQASMFWLYSFTSAVVLLRKGDEARCGAWLGVFALKPQLALPLIVALIVMRKMRALAVGLCVAIGITGVAWLILPEQSLAYITSLSEIANYVSGEGSPAWGQHSVLRATELLLGWLSPEIGLALGAVLSVLLVLVALRIGRAKISADRKIASSLVIGMLASPHLYLYDLSLGILAYWLVRPVATSLVRGWTGAAYVAAFASSYTALVQVRWIGAAVQWSLPIFVGWALRVAQDDGSGDKAAASSPAAL